MMSPFNMRDALANRCGFVANVYMYDVPMMCWMSVLIAVLNGVCTIFTLKVQKRENFLALILNSLLFYFIYLLDTIVPLIQY